MKIAIHHRKGSFSDRWITHCIENKLDYKIVDCYSNDIVEQLVDCDILLWNFHQSKDSDFLFARSVLFSFEYRRGKASFPSFKESWHFDDKIAQKYLLETINAPFADVFIFYNKDKALEWVNKTTFPKVFKLKSGASSVNVHLVHTADQARKFIDLVFGKGLDNYYKRDRFKKQIKNSLSGKEGVLGIPKAFLKLFFHNSASQLWANERNYCYFQQFLPNNAFDIRVVVIGDKAIAIKRMVRENDFRASGSGFLVYDKDQISIDVIRVAFDVNKKLGMQCVAYDFVYDHDNNPIIIEIGYTFSVAAYDKCEGYWDSELNWHAGGVNTSGWILDNLIKKQD